MKKKTNDRGIISITKRTTEEWVSVAATAFSVFLIGLGVVGLYLVQTSLDQPQDLRQQASVDQGQVEVSVGGPSNLSVGQTNSISIYANTNGLNTNGVQLVFNIVTDTLDQPPVINDPSSGLDLFYSEVEQTADGYLVGLAVVPDPPGSSFSSNSSNFTLLNLSVQPARAGSITFNFDRENSISVPVGSDQDELTHVPSATFPVTDSSTASPSPDATSCVRAGCSSQVCVSADQARDVITNCVYLPEYACYDNATCEVQANGECGFTQTSELQQCLNQYRSTPTPSSSSSPANSPDPTPSPSPSPTTSPDPTPSPTPPASPTSSPNDNGTGGPTVKSCNESCTSNSECEVNHRCYDNRCRLVTNVSSSSCQAADDDDPGDQGLNRSCNEYCADSDECAAGYLCWNNRCRNPLNVESQSCAQLTTVQYQQYVSSCNQSCFSNNDCATNLRCYQGKCRLATNVSSISCSPPSAQTVSNVYTNQNPQAPKGSDFLSNGSATDSASAGTRPSPSLNPAADPSPNPTTFSDDLAAEMADETALEALTRNLQDRGVSFPLAMIASGFGLILLILFLLALANRGGGAQPNRRTAQRATSPAQKQQLNDLQQRINTLQKEKPPTPKPGSTMQQPPTGAPTPPPPPAQPNQPLAPKPSQASEPAPAQLRPDTTPASQTPASNSSNPSNSMVDKLKQRGTVFTQPDQPPKPPQS